MTNSDDNEHGNNNRFALTRRKFNTFLTALPNLLSGAEAISSAQDIASQFAKMPYLKEKLSEYFALSKLASEAEQILGISYGKLGQTNTELNKLKEFDTNKNAFAQLKQLSENVSDYYAYSHRADHIIGECHDELKKQGVDDGDQLFIDLKEQIEEIVDLKGEDTASLLLDMVNKVGKHKTLSEDVYNNILEQTSANAQQILSGRLDKLGLDTSYTSAIGYEISYDVFEDPGKFAMQILEGYLPKSAITPELVKFYSKDLQKNLAEKCVDHEAEWLNNSIEEASRKKIESLNKDVKSTDKLDNDDMLNAKKFHGDSMGVIAATNWQKKERQRLQATADGRDIQL